MKKMSHSGAVFVVPARQLRVYFTSTARRTTRAKWNMTRGNMTAQTLCQGILQVIRDGAEAGACPDGLSV